MLLFRRVFSLAPAVDLLRLNRLRGTKTAFFKNLFNPIRYDKHPVLSTVGVPARVLLAHCVGM